MAARSITVFRSVSTWVVAAAFLLALLSIAVVTTLQHRADKSRDAQVTLGQIERDFDALQSIPFDANGQGAVAQAVVRRRMRASEQRIARRVAQLRRDHATSHLADALVPYRLNVATLDKIEGYVARGQDSEGDQLGAGAGRSQARVGQELGEAADDYRRRASSSLTLATLGSTVVILALVTLFAVFYLRSHTAHATAQRLARENERFLLEDSQLQVIQRLALAAEYRDDDTGQHTRRVGELSVRIGTELGLPGDKLALLRQAAPLHDVGKIAIPDSILLKPGPLTPREFEQMKDHTTRGADMLMGPGFALLEMAEEIALTHHERWDGNGYPSGLSGSGIPLVGRIVAVADVFDALTHARPYKHAWTLEDALAEIGAQGGRQFDPEIVDAFLRVVHDDAADTARPRKALATALSP
jgi:HD-GYP domain-containing protein (c-di-GMP phosphodiesterase class II)